MNDKSISMFPLLHLPPLSDRSARIPSHSFSAANPYEQRSAIAFELSLVGRFVRGRYGKRPTKSTKVWRRTSRGGGRRPRSEHRCRVPVRK